MICATAGQGEWEVYAALMGILPFSVTEYILLVMWGCALSALFLGLRRKFGPWN